MVETVQPTSDTRETSRLISSEKVESEIQAASNQGDFPDISPEASGAWQRLGGTFFPPAGSIPMNTAERRFTRFMEAVGDAICRFAAIVATVVHRK